LEHLNHLRVVDAQQLALLGLLDGDLPREADATT
jgi:hypothetical protein